MDEANARQRESEAKCRDLEQQVERFIQQQANADFTQDEQDTTD